MLTVVLSVTFVAVTAAGAAGYASGFIDRVIGSLADRPRSSIDDRPAVPAR